jgi:hypothetical protein
LDLPTNPRVCIVFLCSSHLQPASFIDLSLSPRSLRCGIADVKTGLELVKDHLRKSHGHDVGILQICGHMNYALLAERYQFMNKVYIYLNILCPSMINRVVGEVHSRHIVAVDGNSLLNIDVELLKKIAQLATLGCGIDDTMVLCFSARTGNHRLPLGGLGY